MDIRKAVTAINRRSAGLLKFTETYRQLTKVPPPKFLQVDPVELMEDVLTLLTPKLNSLGVQVVRQFPHKPVVAHLDPDLMEQVFINLINNAIHAMAGIGQPVLTLHIFRSSEGELEIQIEDNGKGIPEDLIDQVFVPFFTTKDEGSGIGLSLSRQIIHLHKGNIFVVSKPGKGTVFTIKV
jgi:signal transduction histidine kinase